MPAISPLVGEIAIPGFGKAKPLELLERGLSGTRVLADSNHLQRALRQATHPHHPGHERFAFPAYDDIARPRRAAVRGFLAAGHS